MSETPISIVVHYLPGTTLLALCWRELFQLLLCYCSISHELIAYLQIRERNSK
ncbi:hypothetical protein YQE_04595, partial [Dendroctonus ponderosae]